jgi:hypothetical protein
LPLLYIGPIFDLLHDKHENHMFGVRIVRRWRVYEKNSSLRSSITSSTTILYQNRINRTRLNSKNKPNMILPWWGRCGSFGRLPRRQRMRRKKQLRHGRTRPPKSLARPPSWRLSPWKNTQSPREISPTSGRTGTWLEAVII